MVNTIFRVTKEVFFSRHGITEKHGVCKTLYNKAMATYYTALKVKDDMQILKYIHIMYILII